jgi:hypothetical protein
VKSFRGHRQNFGTGADEKSALAADTGFGIEPTDPLKS